MVHSKWLKNAKMASIRCTLGSFYAEPDFSRTCGFHGDLGECWFYLFYHLRVPSSCVDFRENSKNHRKQHVSVIIE